MFCIYQLDDKNKETVIDLIESKDEYLPKIMTLIKDKYSVKSLDGIQFNDIKMNDCFSNGYYLLNNESQIELVLKDMIYEQGYVYSSLKLDVKLLFTWKLIPFEGKTFKISDPDKYICLDSDSDSEIIFSKKMPNSDKFIYTSKTLTETDSSDFAEPNSFEEQYTDDIDPDFELPTFELDNMVNNPSILLIAKRGSGKTWVIRDIINNQLEHITKPVKELIIMSPTERMIPFYQNHYPNATILYEYNAKTIEQYLAKRANDREYMQNNPGCIVLDDCLSNKNMFESSEFKELVFNGRQYNTTFILTMQFPHNIKPEIRGNMGYIFLFAEDFYSNQKRIYDHYGKGMFPNFDTFRHYLTENTKDYHAVLINNKGIGSDAYKFKALN